MDRISLIQYLIKKYNYKSYLEIGTQEGKSFFPIKCKTKIAIDPNFKIKSKDRYHWLLKNHYNLGARFFEITSDDFFLKEEKILNRLGKIDIVLVDGLHTFHGTLKDVLNSLNHLQYNGIIVMHDCFPPHKAASIAAENELEAVEKGKNIKGWTGEWCGESWKAMVYLRKKYPEKLEAYVLNMDYGLGIVKIRDAELDLNINQELFDEVNKLTYEDLIKDPQKIIGLKNKKDFELI